MGSLYFQVEFFVLPSVYLPATLKSYPVYKTGSYSRSKLNRFRYVFAQSCLSSRLHGIKHRLDRQA
jgi:hypothetical protein